MPVCDCGAPNCHECRREFRSLKPEIVQWDGDQSTYDLIGSWTLVRDAPDNNYDLVVRTPEGDRKLLLGNWIVRSGSECRIVTHINVS